MMDAKKVDVLAVLDEFALKTEPFGSIDEAANQYTEARAAVSELIDAARRVLDKEWEYGEEQPHCVRLSEALSRIGAPA